MPYADPEKQIAARRAWGSARQRLHSGYRQSSSKYDDIFDWCEANPGEWRFVAAFHNQNSASVLGWRISRRFYRAGTWESTTRGRFLFARYLAAAAPVSTETT